MAMPSDTMKYLLKLIHKECGGDKAIVDSLWSEIQSEVEEVEEEEVMETHLDKHISPHTTPRKKGIPKKPKKIPGSQYRFAEFTAENVEDISAKSCHIRREKKVDGVTHFYQCSKTATKRGGYCSGCIKTHATRAAKYPDAPGQMAISMDGDIRIVGGTPEMVAGIIRDEQHRGYLQFGVCAPCAGPVKYLRPIPAGIVAEYNLPLEGATEV
jgi:hypothetical protein